MKNKILGINTDFACVNMPNFHQDSFQSCCAFIDYDAVLISTHNLSLLYEIEDREENYSILTKTATKQMKTDFSHIKSQITDMLEQGKYVFIMQGDCPERYFYTGEKQLIIETVPKPPRQNKKRKRGKKKNEVTETTLTKKVAMVAKFNPLTFLPIKCKYTFAKGNNFGECTVPIYSDFFARTNNFCYYNAYAELPEEQSLVKVAQTNFSVASIYEYANGKIIFLPMLSSLDAFNDQAEWQRATESYIEQLQYLVEQLNTPIIKYTLPEWTEEISILNERKEINKLIAKTEKLQRLEKAVHKQKIKLDNLQSFKQLLTADGHRLIAIVTKTLKEIGIKVDEKKQYGSNIFAKRKTTRIVAEVIAARKCAVGNHVTALERLTSQNIPRNGISPKPILILNAYYKLPFDKRPTMIFPYNLVKYAAARKHCLISTTQLLCLFLEIKSNPKIKEERIQELMDTVGVYERYTDPYKILFYGNF